MKEQLQKRLQALRAEFETGQQKLTQLEEQARATRDTLLRISGAIQVLEETLQAAEKEQEHNGQAAQEVALSAS